MQPTVHALGAKPLADADLHLTLAFLGDVAAEDVAGLLRATEGVASAPVQLSLAQVDCWSGSRVLCLLPDDSAELAEARRLAFSLDDAIRAVGLAPDAQPFRAHVTIARKVPPAALRSRQWPEPLRAPLPFTANGFVLMESTRAPEGRRYNVIHAWPVRPPGDS
jgi:2'-5' RNA ligase